jgi:proteasome lid subunit RPN8/RPN11
MDEGNQTPKRTVFLPDELRSRLAAWAIEGYPRETCGLLIGRADGTETRVRRAVLARNLNVARAHDRFELDPQDFLAADREARGAGLEIVGIWHTHPDHPARPSPTDLESAWEGWSYVIASVTRDGVADLRAWRLAGSALAEEEIQA